MINSQTDFKHFERLSFVLKTVGKKSAVLLCGALVVFMPFLYFPVCLCAAVFWYFDQATLRKHILFSKKQSQLNEGLSFNLIALCCAIFKAQHTKFNFYVSLWGTEQQQPLPVLAGTRYSPGLKHCSLKTSLIDSIETYMNSAQCFFFSEHEFIHEIR